MSLVKRSPRPQNVIEDNEPMPIKTPEELFELLRDGIREKLREGLASHDAQDNQAALCALVDEIELTMCPRKKE